MHGVYKIRYQYAALQRRSGSPAYYALKLKSRIFKVVNPAIEIYVSYDKSKKKINKKDVYEIPVILQILTQGPLSLS